jgi:hypothetical protein
MVVGFIVIMFFVRLIRGYLYSQQVTEPIWHLAAILPFIAAVSIGLYFAVRWLEKLRQRRDEEAESGLQ